MAADKDLALWAYSVIKEHADNRSFGVITIPMANGVISGVKCEINHRPPKTDIDAK